jgi:hypothetical protein
MFSASSLARDFSLVRATSSSLIRNSNILRSSITLRSIGHPDQVFGTNNRPSTDRSASRIRINNASIARCSTRLAPLRHEDGVLNRRKTQGNDVTAKKIFAGRSRTTPTQNFESLDLAHCAMKPPSTGIGSPVTYDA